MTSSSEQRELFVMLSAHPRVIPAFSQLFPNEAGAVKGDMAQDPAYGSASDCDPGSRMRAGQGNLCWADFAADGDALDGDGWPGRWLSHGICRKMPCAAAALGDSAAEGTAGTSNCCWDLD